jgi:hypothetical protein
MVGQYQTDVIGRPFSGVDSVNGAMVVSESPQFGKRQNRKGKDDTNPEDLHNKLTGRFDDEGYY